MGKVPGFGEGKTGLAVSGTDERVVRWLTGQEGIPVVGVHGKGTGAKVIIRHESTSGTPSLWQGLYVPRHTTDAGFRVVHAWSGTTDPRYNLQPREWFNGRAEYDVYPGEKGGVRVVDFFADTCDGPDRGAEGLEVAGRALLELSCIASAPQDELWGGIERTRPTAERLPDDIIRAAAHFVLASCAAE